MRENLDIRPQMVEPPFSTLLSHSPIQHLGNLRPFFCTKLVYEQHQLPENGDIHYQCLLAYIYLTKHETLRRKIRQDKINNISQFTKKTKLNQNEKELSYITGPLHQSIGL